MVVTRILAAGPGVRLRPLTHDRPKTLLLAAGRPIIADLLDALDGPTTIVTGHGHRALQAYLGDHAGLTFVEQGTQLGPGHALFQAKGTPGSDEFLVLPGDSWYHPDLIRRLRDAPAPAMIQVPDSRSGRHGVPVVEGGMVTQLLELEQAADRATSFCGGAYKMNRRIFSELEAHGFSMRDAIRADIAARGPWNLVKAKPNEYVDVIEVQDLLRVHDLLMPDVPGKIEGTVREAHVSGVVSIGEGTTIHPGAVIQGPVTIGKHCDIGPGAVLLPGTSIRNRSRIGPLTVLERCSVGSNVTIGSHGRIEDCVMDHGAAAGSYLHVEASTGIIIGADAQLGDRVTVTQGAVIGRNARVASGRTVGDVPDGGQAV